MYFEFNSDLRFPFLSNSNWVNKINWMPKRCGHIILSIRLHVLIKNQFKKIFKSKKSKNFGFFWIWFLDILDFWIKFWIWFLDILDFWIKFWIWFLDILDFWIWIWIWISKSKTKSKIQNFLDSGVWPEYSTLKYIRFRNFDLIVFFSLL